ncbi:MAG TPA: VWA domain-containing protein [Syntrophales bacterium]|nr:VWA domain-containing protein [Syntrophales bacterium]HOM06368.1 VWA domain-containing protein [Syntrophales bacterium]HON99181.1 VWA domain-containing protein [Syntrophales bacterium]HPC00289.1 VWA domain-containing protein [Syntrophales bacterium]HPQ05952.1 VWA domain-containing protein [Syntrophales bacterium]
MEELIRSFCAAARQAGVRISTAETMDALRAVAVVGPGDRRLLRHTLGVTLAKSIPEKLILEETFDRFFASGPFQDLPREGGTPGGEAAGTVGRDLSPLSSMLLMGDQAGLLAALGAAAAREDLGRIQYGTQVNITAWRILESMGIAALDRDLEALRRGGERGAEETAERLGELRSYLAETVREYVRRQTGVAIEARRGPLEEARLRHANLSGLEMRDYERMHLVVRRIVKKLNDLYSRRRRRARRGQLDFKGTFRRNVPYQGILFETVWRRRKVDRPQIVAICDVSRSVIRVVRFLLLFLYSLNREIVGIRSFAFCTNIVEISHLLERFKVGEALARIQNSVDLDLIMGRTDYERAFGDFRARYIDAVGPKTTVLILGDARNNYNDPCPENLKAIFDRCRQLIWLNPEIPSLWGTGDSEIRRYAPYCTKILKCYTLSHLERLVASLLRN